MPVMAVPPPRPISRVAHGRALAGNQGKYAAGGDGRRVASGTPVDEAGHGGQFTGSERESAASRRPGTLRRGDRAGHSAPPDNSAEQSSTASAPALRPARSPFVAHRGRVRWAHGPGFAQPESGLRSTYGPERSPLHARRRAACPDPDSRLCPGPGLRRVGQRGTSPRRECRLDESTGPRGRRPGHRLPSLHRCRSCLPSGRRQILEIGLIRLPGRRRGTARERRVQVPLPVPLRRREHRQRLVDLERQRQVRGPLRQRIGRRRHHPGLHLLPDAPVEARHRRFQRQASDREPGRPPEPAATPRR